MNSPERATQLLEGSVVSDAAQQAALRARVIEPASEGERETFLQMLGLEPYEAATWRRV